jgi:hypothetical protein
VSSLYAVLYLSKKAAKKSGVKPVLESYGYDINKIGNLVALPCTLDGACHLEVQLHRGDHTSFTDNDDEHPTPYHVHVMDIMQKAVEFIEKNCESGSSAKVQARMDNRSEGVLEDIENFYIRLTRVHKCFKHKEIGCNGKSSVGDLDDSRNDDNAGCNRNHNKEYPKFPKKKYSLSVGK